MNAGLEEWLSLLEARHPVEIELGLDRVAEVYQRLGDVRPGAHIVSVAGTNGKGSCVAMLDAILRAAGLTVGSYTSPHLLNFNERITINGRPVSDRQLCKAFERIDAVRGDVSLTYFEFTTLAAFVIMAECGVDVAVLEVGLGGRLDAVNILDADISIVTSIALDHQSWLGDTREAVAVEKLGIARANRPLLCGEQDLPDNFVTEVARCGADGLYFGSDFTLQADGGWFVDRRADAIHYNQLPEPLLPSASVACAIQAAVLLGVQLPVEQLSELLVSTGLTGRFQRIRYGAVELILDVAHNPAAAAMLARRLKRGGQSSCWAVTAMMSDKDMEGVIAQLAPCIRHWFVGELPALPRAAAAAELQQLLYNSGHSATIAASIDEAIEQACRQASDGDTLLVFGSFFTVSAALHWLAEQGQDI